jgi:hypothetical protein
VTRKAISATFTGFCEQLLAAYPAAPVVAGLCWTDLDLEGGRIVQSRESRRYPSICADAPGRG